MIYLLHQLVPFEIIINCLIHKFQIKIKLIRKNQEINNTLLNNNNVNNNKIIIIIHIIDASINLEK